MHSPYTPDTALLSIYLKETQSYVHTKSCTQMFTATLPITAPNWKRSESPAMGPCSDKLRHTQHTAALSGKKEQTTDGDTQQSEWGSRTLH